MEDIIFKNVLDNINKTSVNFNNYFDNLDYYNNNIYDIIKKLPKYNIIIYIFIVFILFNFFGRLNIRLNEVLVTFISFVLIYFLIKKDYTEFIEYTKVKKNELNFLHKLMFDDNTWDYERKTNVLVKPLNSNNKSYLYLNPLLVQFFYNIREYSQYNTVSYVNSLLHCNNVIGLEEQSKIGLNNSYENYTVAVDEAKKALNELNSVIYSLPLTLVTYNKFDESIKYLHGLLNQHIRNIGIVFKNYNKHNDFSKEMMPDNFYDSYFSISPDDTKTMGYKSVYNMF
jgi:hypothetical protein